MVGTVPRPRYQQQQRADPKSPGNHFAPPEGIKQVTQSQGTGEITHGKRQQVQTYVLLRDFVEMRQHEAVREKYGIETGKPGQP